MGWTKQKNTVQIQDSWKHVMSTYIMQMQDKYPLDKENSAMIIT